MRIAARAQADSLTVITEAQASAREAHRITDAAVEGEVQLGQMINQSVQFREMKRVANLGSIVNNTADQLGDAEVPDVEPDHDWTARFFEYAQDVSTEGMQSLWAKVLAGQVERPGSSSLHTLGILRDLDRDTARLFMNLCSLSLIYVTGGTEIVDARVVSLGGNAGDNALKDYGLHYGALTRLEEHGLITPDHNSWKDYSAFPNTLHRLAKATPGIPSAHLFQVLQNALTIKYAGDAWYLQHLQDSPPNREIRINGVAMSSAGMELSNIVDLVPNNNYSTALATFFRGTNLELIRFRDRTALH